MLQLGSSTTSSLHFTSHLKSLGKFREDVQTLPIEINVQSAGVSQEDQVSIQTMMIKLKNNIMRNEAIRRNPATTETAITIQSVSTNLIKQQPEIQVRLRKLNQIIIEPSKDAVLQQLNKKLFH